MTEQRTRRERIANRLFAIPYVAQWWARRVARRMETQPSDGIPWAVLAKPMSRCRVALITTGGAHLADQPPFDMDDPAGDASYRVLGATVDLRRTVITHKYYDHRDADRDRNIVFPLDRMRELAAQGVIGAVAPRHFGLMGHI